MSGHVVRDWADMEGGHPFAWISAAVIVIAVHIGIFYWSDVAHAPQTGLPPDVEAPIMIELPPEMPTEEAVAAPSPDIQPPAPAVDSPPLVKEQPQEMQEPLDEPVAKPEPQPASEPVKQVTQQLPDTSAPSPEADEPAMAQTLPDILPVPTSRPFIEKPQPKETPEPVKRAQVKKKTPPPSPSAPSQARKSATPTKSAAVKNVKAGASKSELDAWKMRLFRRLSSVKSYPSAAKADHAEGVAVIQFRIDTTGRVLSARLTRSSGFSSLDQAALKLLSRASPLPAPPEGAPTTITAPIGYTLD